MFEHNIDRMTVSAKDTALVLTDMHNDFLSPDGKAFPLIRESLEKNGTAQHLEDLLKAAKQYGYEVFISPHYYYPHDHKWTRPISPLEDLGKVIGLLMREDPLSLSGFQDSGADFPKRFKPYICDGKSVVTSPHKAYGTSTNDMILQLRRRRIEKVIVAGPVGNLCVEAHMRDFIENGFEIAMVRDATAGAATKEGHGYDAAMINWTFMANALWTTSQAVAAMKDGARATS